MSLPFYSEALGAPVGERPAPQTKPPQVKPLWALVSSFDDGRKDHWRVVDSQEEAQQAFEELLQSCADLHVAFIAPIHEATEPHYLYGGK